MFSFLVFYLHHQVMLFPRSRDSFVMTTTCDHHKERGLRGPFWDSFPSEILPMRPIVHLFAWEESVNGHLRRAYMKRFCSVSKTRRVRLIHLAHTRADHRKIWDHPGIVVLLGRTSLTSPQLPYAFQRFCYSSIVMMHPP